MMASKKMTSAAPLAGALEWIDRYVFQVGERLPGSKRGDIEMEVRSLLLDEVEQEAGDGAPTERQVLDVLRRYPSPAEMAKQYGAPQGLIGPRYYESFVTVATLVATIVLILGVIGAIAGAITGRDGFSIWGTVSGLFTSVLTALGVVTLIFALVERYADGEEWKDVEERNRWDPASLPQVDARNKITVTEMISDIVSILVTVLWLQYYVRDDGTISIFYGEWGSIQVFSQVFVSFIPWIVAVWTAELLVTMVAGAQGRWTTVTRLLAVLTSGAGVVVLSLLLNAGPLALPAFLEPIVRLVVLVAIAISLWDIGRHLWALFRMRTHGAGRLVVA